MILGMRTVIYPVSDLQKAKDWYTKVLEKDAYFDEVFYVGFQVGGFELGLIPDGISGIAGSQALWGVTDVQFELDRLLKFGASLLEPATEVGGGIVVAAVKDPFGNRFGLVHNPHFDCNAVR
ncbi:VOC family protein [Undibacterium fentianense]|uniref:VOC family protein n=1 Tax=Undibacterium fentianense TaxID=2828728 RepID=A0A941E4H6_9BURK|nr:VOC family protein [Undibacterium fentianense]MBR7799588.1 VOC family protein [Undibacterium fentianense]